MSPWALPTRPKPARFPRVSGDEPRASILMARHAMFSPRERG